jgi:hypothetical protein
MADPATATPPAHERDEPAPPWLRHWPVLAMAGVGVVLLGFFAYSQTVDIPFGNFPRPPLYGRWDPVLSPYALWMFPAVALLAAVAWLITARRVRTWLALALVVGSAVATAAAVAVVRGDWHELILGVSTVSRRSLYTTDLHFVYEYGVRGFVESHAELVRQFQAYNSRTHPAGVLVFLFVLFETFGAAHPLRITTAIAAIALAAAAAAWLMGRTIGGERAGRIAAVLFVAAPGPLLLAYTSMDAIFAVILSMAVALFMLAIHRASPLTAAAGGAVLAIGTLMTYATAFIALAAVIAVGIQSPGIRTALKLLGAGAAGGLAVLAVARLTLGFDLLASYDAAPRSRTHYDPYWIFAHPASVLIWAGLPLAALGVAGLLLKVPGARRPVLPLVLVVTMLVWGALPAIVTGLRYGEVERTWAFLYPVLAAVAGPVVDRWTSTAGRWSGAIVAALVTLSVAQTALLQALWNNLS